MNDDHHGHGGSYIADPKTGQRKLVERTAEPKDPDPAAPVTETE